MFGYLKVINTYLRRFRLLISAQHIILCFVFSIFNADKISLEVLGTERFVADVFKKNILYV